MKVFDIEHWPTDDEYRLKSGYWIAQWATLSEPTRHLRCYSFERINIPLPRLRCGPGDAPAYARLFYVEDGPNARYRSIVVEADGSIYRELPLAGIDDPVEYQIVKTLFSKGGFTHGTSVIAAAVKALGKSLTREQQEELSRQAGGILRGYRKTAPSPHRPLFFENSICQKRVGPSQDQILDVHCYFAPRPLND